VLTTHYLDEAEMLCERVAMLREGRIVALDRTANLLQSGAERRLLLDLDTPDLPDFLRPRLKGRDGNHYILDLPDYADLEGILAQLRAAGIVIRDLALRQPDLEEVFLKIMHAHQ
jgi:ABC-2 type transport system ATP-binding protein